MRTTAVAVLCIVASLASNVGAEPQDVTAAARAFAEGQSAFLAEDYERAAQSFELADSIVPSKEALRSAIRARQQLGQLQRAASLAATLLLREPDDAASIKLTTDIIAAAQAQFARVRVSCPSRCSVSIDQKAISFSASSKHVFFAPPGSHIIEASFVSGQTVKKTVMLQLGVDAIIDLLEPAPPPPAKPVAVPKARAAARPSGLSPGLTVFGAIVTVGLAGASTWSGLETVKAHDDYVANPDHPRTLYDAGRAKQLRTNILWAGTAVAGLTTTLIAVFWTRWSKPRSEKALAVQPLDGGGYAAGLAGRF